MDGVNLQASVNNVTQMDRHQHDFSRTPLVNTEQNAEIARTAAEMRMIKPNETEDTIGKKVDSKHKDQDRRKNQNRRQSSKNENASGKLSGNGHFVDVEV